MSNRRDFLRTAGIAGAGAALYGSFGRRRAWAFAQSPTNLRKFVTTLPGLGPPGANNIGQYLPVASATSKMFAGMATDVYNIGVKQFGEKMHPDLPGAAHFWGYYDLATGDQKYLGGVVVAKRGKPVLFNVTNQLPNKALIPIDPTIMAGPNGVMVGDLPLNRIAVHVHGGFSPWFSDGTPLQWFDPTGRTGASFHECPGHRAPSRDGNHLLPHGPKREALVVPRPRDGDHPYECLLGDRHRAGAGGRLRNRSGEFGAAAGSCRHSARHSR